LKLPPDGIKALANFVLPLDIVIMVNPVARSRQVCAK
jgi:hypothetical protein